jgi:hypothetical protein
MRSKAEIVDIIKTKEKNVIDNLEHESIDVYNFLQTEFKKQAVDQNYLFQFVYRSFYRLDNAGLSKEFKDTYFRIMEECRNQTVDDLTEIIMRLYQIKRLKGDNSVQFSFATKLMNTIQPDYPIYDSEVATVFNFPTDCIGDLDKRIGRYIGQHATIIETYREIIQDNLLKSSIDMFDDKFKNNRLSSNKKLDFIVWSTGKLLKKI